jgi:hypothetical protein
MTRLQLGFVATLLAGGVAAYFILQRQSELRDENRALRQQVEQLTPLQAENGRLSNLLAQANSGPAPTGDQLIELMKLRGEVGVLRGQTNELGKLQNENRRLQFTKLASQAGMQVAAEDSLPKESWGFVGYADPESAFQSMVWAMREGDAKAFRAGLAPGSDEYKDSQDKSDADLSEKIKSETEKVTAFKIVGNNVISGDTTIVTVIVEGLNGVARFRMQRIGNSWKMAGRVEDGDDSDAK